MSDADKLKMLARYSMQDAHLFDCLVKRTLDLKNPEVMELLAQRVVLLRKQAQLFVPGVTV